MRKLIGIAVAAMAMCAAPALADTTSTPPGAPCSKNNGNPCRGNNGNLGAQGNVGHEKVKIDKNPPPIDLSMPPVTDRGVFITQVGTGNEASVQQTAPNAYARVTQSGDENDADIAQTGSGTAYVDASQTGTANFARVQQSGSGQNVAYVTQQGNNNWLWSNQNAIGAVYNGARLSQTGNGNDMQLVQDGSDNLADLSQEGDDNGMTAVQLGEGNRLAWVQDGSNLSDLQITQTGGAAIGGQLLITQTNVGGGH
jgi:minor curlin subunit